VNPLLGRCDLQVMVRRVEVTEKIGFSLAVLKTTQVHRRTEIRTRGTRVLLTLQEKEARKRGPMS